MRLKLTLSYDGSAFSGWAPQPDRRTVHEELLRALLRLYEGVDDLAVAGRTDAGVHALANVVSVEVAGGPPADKAAVALNSILPLDLAVLRSESAPAAFSARYDARSRSYRYRIWNSSVPSALESRRALWHPRRLDIAALNENAAALVGAARIHGVHACGHEAHRVRARGERGTLVAARRAGGHVRDHRELLPPPHGPHRCRLDARRLRARPAGRRPPPGRRRPNSTPARPLPRARVLLSHLT